MVGLIMFDKRLRSLKDMFITPLADLVGRFLSPNEVSLLAFAVGLGCMAFIAFNHLIAAIVFWVINRVLDGMDGLIARRSGRASDAGGYLDIMLDFLVYAGIPLAIAWTDATLALVCAAMMASFYVNSASWMYLSAVFEKHGNGASDRGEKTSISMPLGIVEGGETIIFYILMILVPTWRMVLFHLLTGLTFLGAAIRFWQGFKFLRQMKNEPTTNNEYSGTLKS